VPPSSTRHRDILDCRRTKRSLHLDESWLAKGDRITDITVYVRIRDGKFWIEEDWTEDGIATDLVRAGVPKEDIVLAFHEPGCGNTQILQPLRSAHLT
jgi:XisI protein.